MISYKFKLYKSKKTKYLDATMCEACGVWNHALALQRRYYRLFGKFIPKFTLAKHMTKVWQRHCLGSQSMQEVTERLDKSYSRFFKHKSKRPPKFKKAKDFTSFVFKQCGYKFEGNRVTLTVGGARHMFKFSKSREIVGNIKTVTVKRSHLNEYYIVVVTDGSAESYSKTHNGATVGIDFGLKTYLTLSDGETVNNPQYLKHALKEVRKSSRKLSKCQKGSNHKEQARLAYCRLQETLVNKRSDFQWKLAHELCKRYDFIFLETLNLNGMTRLWGRKVNDLAHGEFVSRLEYVAVKYGCTVRKIDKFFPSSKLCTCGYKNSTLKLSDRKWVCPQCGQVHNRDLLAAQNILREGIHELESESKTKAQ